MRPAAAARIACTAAGSTGAPAWPRYTPGGAYMLFDNGARVQRGLMPGMYDLNEEIVRRRRASFSTAPSTTW